MAYIQKCFYPVLGFVFLFFGLINPVSAEKNNAINVAIFKGTPWSNLGTEKTGDGIVPIFWKEIAKRSGLKLNLHIQPYKRMINSLKAGTDDVAIFFRSSKSEAVAEPVKKIITLPTVVISKEAGKTHSYDDLASHIIAVKKGVFYEPVFDNDQSINKIHARNYSSVIDLLLYERATAAVGSKVSLAFHLAQKKQKVEDFSKPYVLKNNEVYFHISKKKHAFLRT